MPDRRGIFSSGKAMSGYAIVDMHVYEKIQVTLKLMNELAKKRKSGEEKGRSTLETVEGRLGIVHE